MGKGSKRRSAARGAANQEPADVDPTQQENEKLKLELFRMKKRMKLERAGTSAPKSAGTQHAMKREVHKCTKTSLWKICKFIKNETKQVKATKFVMEKLDLAELEGLEGEELVNAQETWKATYKEEVRWALNKQRNYVQQELREVMEKEVFQKNRIHEFPNEEQILELILRDKLDIDTPAEEKEKYRTMFDNYWNVLLPKVAGHSSWGPSKRHHQLISFGKEDPKDKEAPTYVSESDEAFLAVIWLNCYKKWLYRHNNPEKIEKEKPAEEEPSKKKKKKGAKDDDEDDDDETDVEAEEHPDLQTPYTSSKSGQKKFGGWNSAGIKKYTELLDEIKKMRKEQAKYVREVENEALERIRKLEKVEEKEANRKTKKRNGKKEAGDFDNEEDDENDYAAW